MKSLSLQFAKEILRKEILRKFFRWVIQGLERRSPFKTVTLCLQHRGHTRELFQEAFSSGEDVLLVSIMSQSTLKEFGALLAQDRERTTKWRVLTWDPNVGDQAIEAFRKHLQEHEERPTSTREQVQRACEGWETIAKKHTNVIVRRYQSSPTMQGFIVANKLCLVELLPFATHPQQRPALILRSESDRDAFQAFKKSFEQLWNTGTPLQSK